MISKIGLAIGIVSVLCIVGLHQFNLLNESSLQTLRSLTNLTLKGSNDIPSRMRRLAIVRPFSLKRASELPSSFDDWDTFIPCNIEDRVFKNTKKENVAIDMFLSFAQSYDKYSTASQAANQIMHKFQSDDNPWKACFQNIRLIEANIPLEEDLYEPRNADSDVNWVNGPNRQFEKSVKSIQNGDFGVSYDAVFVMEADSVPIKQHWLDLLVDEVQQKAPFAILGSKYDGDSWDSFRDKMPLALLHHINGNAIYNITHPLFIHVLDQLVSEAKTPYNSVPYDYRIAQILVEGSHGIEPQLNPSITSKFPEFSFSTKNTETFSEWWVSYGDNEPVKQSSVISNYASTNLLPKYVDDAAIVHGAQYFSSWEPSKHQITLVVSEWQHHLAEHMLSKSQIDSSSHPFSAVTLMVPPKHTINNIETTLPVTIHERTSPDFMDICSAPVTTEWFMITNAYHTIVPEVDLLFTVKDQKPVIPFTPANNKYCFPYKGCKSVHLEAKKIYPAMKFVVLDFELLFHTATRDEFCRELSNNRELAGEEDNAIPMPSATSYIAYLLSKNKARDIYAFTDRTIYGSRPVFAKIFIAEEMLSNHPYSAKVYSSSTDYNHRAMQENVPSAFTKAPTDAPSAQPSASIQPSASPSIQPSVSMAPTKADVTGCVDVTGCRCFCYSITNVPFVSETESVVKCDWAWVCGCCPECNGLGTCPS